MVIESMKTTTSKSFLGDLPEEDYTYFMSVVGIAKQNPSVPLTTLAKLLRTELGIKRSEYTIYRELKRRIKHA